MMAKRRKVNIIPFHLLGVDENEEFIFELVVIDGNNLVSIIKDTNKISKYANDFDTKFKPKDLAWLENTT
jgi:hypothetical protein